LLLAVLAVSMVALPLHVWSHLHEGAAHSDGCAVCQVAAAGASDPTASLPGRVVFPAPSALLDVEEFADSVSDFAPCNAPPIRGPPVVSA